MATTNQATRPSRDAQLAWGREVLQAESRALADLARKLDERFLEAVGLCAECRGHVVVSGIGKAGLIGRKIAATLASTGTPSHFLHAAEAFHGDLGALHQDDVLLVLSFSGNTEEIVRLLGPLGQMGNPLIAITGHPDSPLGRAAQVVLELGRLEEACPLGLAPSTSTTAMLALGDALALVASRLRRFRVEDFARFHPGGQLGRKLARVEEQMRPLDQCRVASDRRSVRRVVIECSRPGRRSGAIMLVDGNGRLSGIFTDSDLARLLEQDREAWLDRPIAEVMTRSPFHITAGTRLGDAVRLLAEQHLSELPVVDEDGRPIGLIDITDVLGSAVMPRSETSSLSDEQSDEGTGADTLRFPPPRQKSA